MSHITLLCLALARPGAATGDDPGLRTGRSHEIAVTSSPAAGIEATMPRSGAYAEGIALDAQQRWGESLAAYRRARAEYVRMAKTRPRWSKVIAQWIVKADFQIRQSRKLQQTTHYPQWRWRQQYTSAHTHFYRAAARHDKWLAIRAFTGRGPRALLDATIKDYKAALNKRPAYAVALLGLATLYHQSGQGDAGRELFTKLRRPTSRWMAINLAAYHAAAGHRAHALKLLGDALRYSRRTNERAITSSNHFDTLRADPRFRALLEPASP